MLTINDKYKVIIEDKTFTDQHDDQLKRYLEKVEKDYKSYIVKGVYYKTGFQSNIEAIEDANYVFVDLKKILATIEKYKEQTGSEIFKSYYDYIWQWKNDIDKYKELPASQWGYAQINGFYTYIKEKIPEMEKNDFGYVPNQTGGFYGMWFFNNSRLLRDEGEFELYMQCEFSSQEKKICYKAMAHSENKISKLERNVLTCKSGTNQVNIAEKYGFMKPPRFGSGKTVTLGIYDYGSNEISYLEMEKVINQALENFKQLTNELME